MTPEQEREKLRVQEEADRKRELFFHFTPKGDACDHDWTGPEVRIEGGYAKTCTKCGMDALSHSLRYSD